MLFLFLLICFQLALATKIAYRNHSCVPSAYSKMCILEHLLYHPDEESVIHTFPPNLTHVRITRGNRKVKGSVRIFEINAKLHTMLGRPKILEMHHHAMWHFELPRALEQGFFASLYIPTLTVEPGSETPKVVYLDLSNNYVRDISNASSLVNLEVLLLSDNYIKSIDPITMQNLTKLRILDLSFNYLTKVSMNIYPKSLTHLNLFKSKIESLNYAHLYYPSMEVLNIEQNKLTSFDASALMLAMPKLKMVRVGWNLFDQEELQQALYQLQRHNISIRGEGDEAACAFNEQIVEGVCIAEPDPPRGVMWEIMLTLWVILIVLVLGVLLRWGFLRMQGSK